MSLVRAALRISAYYALRDATLVGENVRDSDIGSIEVSGDGSVRSDEEKPFILIYTDDSTTESAAVRNPMMNGSVDFIAEFGVTQTMTETNKAGESSLQGVGLAATDANLELMIDLVARQIGVALTGDGLWAQLWLRLHDGIERIDRRRAGTDEDGVRLAAGQLRYKLKAISDPVWGADQTKGVWHDFLAALAVEDAPKATALRAFLGPVGPLTSADVERQGRGNTLAEREALGYGETHPGSESQTIGDSLIVLEQTDG